MKYFKTVITGRKKGPVLQFQRFKDNGVLDEVVNIAANGTTEVKSDEYDFLALSAFDLAKIEGEWEMSGAKGVTRECSEMEFSTIRNLVNRTYT